MHAKLIQSCLTLCDLGALAFQAPLSMEFPMQEYWSGFSCSPPGDLPDPGSNVRLMSSALAGRLLLLGSLGKPISVMGCYK